MGINEWPEGERPRERLLSKGHEALSPAELLAISLRTGRRGESAVDLARRLLLHFKGIRGLFAATDDELLNIPGLGPAKVAQIRAVIALGYRFIVEEAKESPLLSDPDKAFKLLICSDYDHSREEFWLLLLDGQKRLIDIISLSKGSINDSQIYPREVLKAVINHRASCLIFAHSHPSGNLIPSQEDQAITNLLTEVCNSIDALVLDHIIIGDSGYFSFAQHGLIINQQLGNEKFLPGNA